MNKKKGQISIEYIAILSFITVALIGVISIGFYYSYSVSDRIKLSHVNNFGSEIVRNAESVYYAGEPSQITITPYLPSGVKEIDFLTDNGNHMMIITVSTSSGETDIPFTSNVNITESLSSPITSSEGVKKIVIKARSDDVLISN